MPTEIRMPELAADMEAADLLSWLVKPGDRIEAGDLIAEIETDKSTVEFESPVSGVLLEIQVPEGTSGVTIGTVLALVESEAEAGDAAKAESAPPEPPPPSATAQPPVATDAPAPAAVETAPAAASAPPADEARPAPPATALARRIASQTGVELAGLRGTGAGGRIVRADVESARGAPGSQAPLSHAPPPQAVAPAAAPSEAELAALVDAPYEAVAHSRMRRTIATRLAEAKRTVPHFYLRSECRIDHLLALRKRLNAEPDGPGLSVNDFVVRAVALALAEVPDANVSFSEDALLRWERVDVAVAVATEGGLVTPVVRDADRKELATLSAELRELAARAREGRLSPADYRGGTFTVSNLGMYGIEAVYPILNPPQACILGVGAGEQRPVVEDGALGVGTLMTCTLSADHRALDGATGARLLGAVQRRLEDPLEMLL